MKIAFGDLSGLDFHALSVETMPLGGSQSAACYLARALAQRGHEVFLIADMSEPEEYGGVQCLAWKKSWPDAVQRLELDALVCVMAPGYGIELRQALGPTIKIILWNQHATNENAVQSLRNPDERGSYDDFVMVSDWQRAEYRNSFGIEPERMKILRNAIAPPFEGQFPEGVSILSQKEQPPVLAYTSTPFRGLDLLLDAFPRIRAAVPGARLEVYSSLKVYHTPAADDEASYGALYQRCRETEGVDYFGSISQQELARRLRRVSLLAYPNIFPETSCIVAMEAMADGCRVVTSALGALPETCEGFARLIPMPPRREDYLDDFVRQTIGVLREMNGGNEAVEALLRRQVSRMNEHATWGIRAREWEQWLERMLK